MFCFVSLIWLLAIFCTQFIYLLIYVFLITPSQKATNRITSLVYLLLISFMKTEEENRTIQP